MKGIWFSWPCALKQFKVTYIGKQCSFKKYTWSVQLHVCKNEQNCMNYFRQQWTKSQFRVLSLINIRQEAVSGTLFQVNMLQKTISYTLFQITILQEAISCLPFQITIHQEAISCLLFQITIHQEEISCLLFQITIHQEAISCLLFHDTPKGNVA